MGVLWYVYCPQHGESLELDKWWHLSRNGKLSLDDLNVIRRDLERYLRDKGPSERKKDYRVMELIKAFIERHKMCGVRSGTDERPAEVGPPKRYFYINDDAFLQSYSEAAWIEGLRRIEKGLQVELERLQDRLSHSRLQLGRAQKEQLKVDTEKRLHEIQD